MTTHHNILITQLDNVYIRYRLDYIKKRYYYNCSFSQPFKTEYFMENLKKEIKRLKKDNDRFKLNKILKDSQATSKELEKLFDSLQDTFYKNDINKQQEIELLVDDLVKNIG